MRAGDASSVDLRSALAAAELATATDTAGDASLWNDLASAAEPRVFGRAWLSIVARTFPPIRQAVLLLDVEDAARAEPIARWAASTADADAERLTGSGQAVLAAALQERRPVIDSPDKRDSVFACAPFVIGAKVRGAVLVEARIDDQMAGRRLLRHLQWASAWIEAFLRRSDHALSAASVDRAAAIIDIVNGVLAEQRLKGAARALANLAARKLDCTRAAVGQRHGQHIRLIAASQSADIDRRTELSAAFEAAMNEAMDQEALLVGSKARSEGRFVAYAQDALSDRLGSAAVITIPLMALGKPFGALTLVRDDGEFSPADIDLADGIAAAAAPILFEKEQNDRSIVGLIALRLRRGLAYLIGPRHLTAKTAVAVGLAGLAYLVLAHDTYRVAARGQVHGELRRIVSAPFDGYVRAQHAVAGDVVREGALLAELQDNDLVLDRLRHLAQRRQYSLEHDRALSRRDLAQVSIARAQVEQKDAEIELTTQMLARAQLRAPFDSVVVSGDLSQSIGKPVSRGETLFELAPLDRYRVTLIVPETDIGLIRAGQRGNLLLTAMPEQPLAIEIKAVTPVARVADGINGFEVTAILKETDPRVRPSMEGTAKIETTEARLIWIWTHSMMHWLRLRIWPWLP